MQAETLRGLRSGEHHKGDVFAAARIAAIQGAKQCSTLIPLCHPLMLTGIVVDLDIDDDAGGVRIGVRCKTDGKTGVEMEALTAVSCAALTLYDMCKAKDRGMVIESIELLEKTGGKSGPWQKQDKE